MYTYKKQVIVGVKRIKKFLRDKKYSILIEQKRRVTEWKKKKIIYK